jgi:hypothetical protein
MARTAKNRRLTPASAKYLYKKGGYANDAKPKNARGGGRGSLGGLGRRNTMLADASAAKKTSGGRGGKRVKPTFAKRTQRQIRAAQRNIRKAIAARWG